MTAMEPIPWFFFRILWTVIFALITTINLITPLSLGQINQFVFNLAKVKNRLARKWYFLSLFWNKTKQGNLKKLHWMIESWKTMTWFLRTRIGFPVIGYCLPIYSFSVISLNFRFWSGFKINWYIKKLIEWLVPDIGVMTFIE